MNQKLEAYINNYIGLINSFEEHRLYKEEQFSIAKEVIIVRNCLNWILRINKVLRHFKYCMDEAVANANKIKIPTEKTEYKDLFSFHIENAVYRELVLWDLFCQMTNEFYGLGYKRSDKFTIWKIIKRLSQGSIEEKQLALRLEKHCLRPLHKFVREYLRNTFTHSGDPHEMFIFHEFNENNLLQPDDSRILPEFHFKEILFILNDNKILNKFINQLNEKVEKLMQEKCILLDVHFLALCGQKYFDTSVPVKVLENMREIEFVGYEGHECSECRRISNDETRRLCKPLLAAFHRKHEPSTIGITILDEENFQLRDTKKCLDEFLGSTFLDGKS